MSRPETIISYSQRAQSAIIAITHTNCIYVKDQSPYYYELVFLIAPNTIGLVDGSRYGMYVHFTTDMVNHITHSPTMYQFNSEIDYLRFRDTLPVEVVNSELHLDDLFTMNPGLNG
ncbi:MAG: hypothetical protein K9H64_22500 [Bacteroidales bacterium]|nr:hypothetical protein [Bacteroidales bacterium]MCF8458806.1 hypothetical protein [Bacteroidales bacterium]